MRAIAIAVLTVAVFGASNALAAVPPTPAPRAVITSAVNDADAVRVTGEVSPMTALAQDRGPVSDDLVFPHLNLFLKRPAERQAALDGLVRMQQQQGGPWFHRWVQPTELGPAFGPANQDIARVSAWLADHGFQIRSTTADGMVIEFSGTARQIRTVFRADIHNFLYKGESYVANVQEPIIPRAFQAAVSSIGLHNFFPKPAMHIGGTAHYDGNTGGYKLASAGPQFVSPLTPEGVLQLVGPNDFAVIYNILPAREGSSLTGYAPLTGLGATIAVIDDSEMHPKDWLRYRKVFGLSAYQGTLTLQNPGNCGDPGYNGAEGEAALDAEWAGAAAPDANIIQASCPSGLTAFGPLTALENIVSVGTLAQLISISYGGCEAGWGPGFLTAWSQASEEGASEGLSIMVASGDGGSNSCDTFSNLAVTGINVNGLASNPYVTAVGGTDFYDTALGVTNQYFAPKNRKGLETALSYIPEMAWNESCASPVFANYRREHGFTTASNPVAYCNDPDGMQFLNVIGGGGAPSGIYGKPDWQSLSLHGVPNDGARDVPDVALFASQGFWGHGLLFCFSDPNFGGVPCDYNNGNDILYLFGGGTSFAAPAFAGIMALATEFDGELQGAAGAVRIGNAAPRLYQLASGQFSTSRGLKTCNATLGNAIAPTCIFNNVTVNTNDVPCARHTLNCYTNKSSTAGIGVLARKPGTSDKEAYAATPGWSFATGLGSVNTTNLLSAYFYY